MFGSWVGGWVDGSKIWSMELLNAIQKTAGCFSKVHVGTHLIRCDYNILFSNWKLILLTTVFFPWYFYHILLISAFCSKILLLTRSLTWDSPNRPKPEERISGYKSANGSFVLRQNKSTIKGANSIPNGSSVYSLSVYLSLITLLWRAIIYLLLQY